MAVCSSSPQRLIEASLGGLGLGDRFELVHSAEHEPAGKPHPACYLSTASMLGVAPSDCVAIEDSVNGAIAAAAAGHVVVALPVSELRNDPRFDFCARVLDGHHQLDEQLIGALLAWPCGVMCGGTRPASESLKNSRSFNVGFRSTAPRRRARSR